MEGWSDEDLIDAVRGGKDRAYEFLVARHQEAVARFVWRVVPNDQDREEVCQDVFVKAYLNLDRFKFDSKFTTWLYSIAWRTAISSTRRKQLAYTDFDEQAEGSAGDGSPEADIADRELARLLHAEIERLSAEERGILTLFHMEGCSVGEIGEILGKPSGTIKSALFRIRKKLKDELEPQLASAGYGEASYDD